MPMSCVGVQSAAGRLLSRSGGKQAQHSAHAVGYDLGEFKFRLIDV